MAEENRPASREQAPNPAHTYERAEHNREAPAPESPPPKSSAPTSHHSMKDDEPTDPDLAPQSIEDSERKRNPRIGGKGGTPDVGEDPRQS
jgi:hypothetical protein